MTHIEAMKQWLKAFEVVRFCVPPAQRKTILDSITSLHQAIEQAAQPKAEQEPVAVKHMTDKEKILQIIKELRPAIRAMGRTHGMRKTTEEWFDLLVKAIEEKV